MLKYFLIFALLTATLAQNSPVIADTFEFNDLWLEAGSGSTVVLTWDYNSGAQTLGFNLSYPVFSKAMPNIISRVFLKSSTNADHSPVVTGNWIGNWSPVRPTLTGVSEVFATTITLQDWDSNTGIYANCQKTDLGGDLEKKTCFGVLAFTHFWSTSTGDAVNGALRIGLDAYALYEAVEKYSLAKWNFEVSTILNRTVEQVVDTNIKTKVTALPCENCGAGCDQCSRDINFVLDHAVCGDEAQLVASTLASKCSARANYDYTFGDRAFFHFYLDVTTRTLSIHSVWAVTDSANPDDVSGTEIMNYVDDVDAANRGAGEYKLSVPMAGPASQAGTGTSFMIKFVFKLQSFTARFLENMNDRVLAAKTPVQYADIKGFKVEAPPKTTTQPTATIQPTKEASNPDMEKMYNLITATIALVCLTCICATVSNIIPMIRKNDFAQVPAKNTV